MPVTTPLVLLASLAASPAPSLDAFTIVRVAAERQVESDRRAGPLACDHAEVQTDFGPDGGREPAARRVFRALTTAGGVSWRELVSVDGRAPTERESKRSREEEEKKRKRAGEGSSDDDLMAGRLPLADLLDRFDFRLVREETVDGRPTHVVDFGPRPGTPRKTLRDRVLNDFAGRAWIDVGELQVVRIEGRLTKPVKVAGGLALNIQDVHIVYEGRPVQPGVWAPCLEEVHVVARAALVFRLSREIRFEFSNYRLERHREATASLSPR